MGMKMTHAGLVEVQVSEGFSSRPYLDKIAKPPVWTNGYGNTIGVGPNTPPVTRAQAEKQMIALFENRFAWALEPFEHLEGFNQNRYDALGSFIWNCGPGSVAPTTTIGRHLRTRDWRRAADAMLAWNKAGGRAVQGLTNRRIRERRLFLTPVDHTDRFYLTDKEREWVVALERARRVAVRHGGWEKVAPLHMQSAKRAKDALRARVKLLKGMDTKRAHRAARIRAMQDVIEPDGKG